MSNYLTFFTLVVLTSCQSRPSEQATGESAQSQPSSQTATATASDTLCFQQVVSRDTTTLKLVINGQQASGYLDNKPYEKDRARGAFTGTVDNNVIRVDWQRSGEGQTQVYPLNFTRNGDTISWYEGERIEQQGKWVLKDPKAGYKYVLTKIACL